MCTHAFARVSGRYVHPTRYTKPHHVTGLLSELPARVRVSKWHRLDRQRESKVSQPVAGNAAMEARANFMSFIGKRMLACTWANCMIACMGNACVRRRPSCGDRRWLPSGGARWLLTSDPKPSCHARALSNPHARPFPWSCPMATAPSAREEDFFSHLHAAVRGESCACPWHTTESERYRPLTCEVLL